jgi:hypothetical protein
MKLFKEFKYSPLISGDLLKIHSVFNKIKKNVTNSSVILSDSSDDDESSDAQIMDMLGGIMPILLSSKDLIERLMDNSLSAIFDGSINQQLKTDPGAKLITFANVISDVVGNDDIIEQCHMRIEGYVNHFGTHVDLSNQDSKANLYIEAIKKEIPIIYEDVLFPALETFFPRKSTRVFKIIISFLNAKQ